MDAAQWRYFPMGNSKPDWRPKNSVRKRTRSPIVSINANEAPDDLLQEAVRRARERDSVTRTPLPVFTEESMEEPLLFYALVAELGDPKSMPVVTEPVSRRAAARRRAATGRLTALVWGSLVWDPQSQTAYPDPAKMVSAALLTTDELPVIKPRKGVREDANV